MADITMPRMSDSMEEGRVIRWLKKEGDRVEKGEPVVEIETDKANMEYESPDSGFLANIKYGDDSETIPVGTVIAELAPSMEMAGVKGGAAAPAEAPPEEVAQPTPPAEERAEEKRPPEPQPQREFAEPTYGAPAAEIPPQAEETVAPKPPAEAPAPPEGVKASPLARRIAQDAGIDLNNVRGTGPGGRITEADVRDYLSAKPAEVAPIAPVPRAQAPSPAPEAPAPTVPPAEVRAAVTGEEELSNIRKTVARRMVQSKTTVPHFYVTVEINMDMALDLHEQLKESHPETKIGVTDMLVKASAKALMEHPDINSYYDNDRLIRHESANIGVAVALEDGLIAPVVKDADKKSLVQISKELKDLVDRSRSGRIRPDEYSGATFTISNLGMFDVDSFQAIVVPPEAAILAVGTAYPQAIVVDDEIRTAHMMKVTLSADHRITDGAGAAKFLQTLKRIMQTPLSLME